MVLIDWTTTPDGWQSATVQCSGREVYVARTGRFWLVRAYGAWYGKGDTLGRRELQTSGSTPYTERGLLVVAGVMAGLVGEVEKLAQTVEPMARAYPADPAQSFATVSELAFDGTLAESSTDGHGRGE